MKTIIDLQIQIFLLVAIGFFLTRKNWVNDTTQKQMVDIILYVLLPCTIFRSFLSIEMTAELIKKTAVVGIVATAMQFCYLFVNRFLYRRFERGRALLMKYATICTNSAFIGLPIIEAVMGAEALVYASIALIPTRVAMWTAGLSLFTETDRKSMVRTLALHPCILAVFLGFLFMGTGWSLPAALEQTTLGLSRCTTSLSMIMVGCILGKVELRKVFDWSVLYYSLIRLLALPFFFLAVLYIFQADKMTVGVTVLTAAMPAGSTTAMLAKKYDQDTEYASKLVCVSTLLSLVTIPLFSILLQGGTFH
ncbi:AEC family transporter [Hominifimenecus sp. rT4P-3]|uniref:AEC family transporter n=1 Tax=Hominifimenecus sp. rT4P-3 TaxID=3242979 RepID=UPI003DA3DD47